MAKIADITSPIRARLIADTYRNWLESNDKVLDIGCGTGVVGNEVSKRLEVKVIGCDIENYLIRKITFKKMDSLSSLPFKSRVFDAAMFNDVLHHTSFNNQLELLKESLRVSQITLIFELQPTLIGKILDYIINKIHNPRMTIPFTYRTEKEWEKLFRKNKIKFEKKRVSSPYFYPFSHVAYRLSKQT